MPRHSSLVFRTGLLWLSCAVLFVGCRGIPRAPEGSVVRSTEQRGRTRLGSAGAPAASDRKGTGVGRVLISALLTGTDFLLPGRELIIGCQHAGLPMVAFERLYLRSGADLAQVDGPDRLVGQVSISSFERALSYVRLFTSPATVQTQPRPWWVEVVPASALSGQLMYGRTEILEGIRRMHVRGDYRPFGVVPDAEWRELGFQAPIVEHHPDRFVVTRTLFRLHGDDGGYSTNVVYRVAQTVSPDGRVAEKVLEKRALEKLRLLVWPER